MQGIYYLVSIVAVFVVLLWYIRNEKGADGESTTGLLAMKDSKAAAPQARKQRWQRGPSA